MGGRLGTAAVGAAIALNDIGGSAKAASGPAPR